jgi:hypothetical protein
MDEYQKDFENNGYVLIRGVIDNNLLLYMEKQIKLIENIMCFEKNIDKTNYAFGDTQCKTSFSYYSSLTTETLLELYKEKIEKITNRLLFPTYSYLRIYYKNSILNKHVDRPSCEYSATICIKNDKQPWGIWFETKDNIEKQIFLNPGDMIIYKGLELPHWRNKYENEEQIQVFLH